MDRAQRPETMDIRWVFRGYAWLVGVAGVLLTGWGPMWLGVDLPGQPFGKAALIRVFGAILIGSACCAAGFAAVDNPAARRRGLGWFAAGHAAIWAAVLLQERAIWGPGVAEKTAQGLSVLVFGLFYCWGYSDRFDSEPQPLISLFGGRKPPSEAELRSQYEQQIRAVARQEERNRLARDLHDSVKQQIFVIQTAAATAQARFEGDPGGAGEALEQVRASAREAMTEMQAMLDQLRAAPLENAGLIESLKKQCEALGFRTGAHVEFKVADLPASRDLPPGAHEAILRAAQEALANVGRHARAANVLVSLGAVRSRVELHIQDDGAGFDANQSGRGQGIANMRARAEEIGGAFELITRPGGGTSVLFSVPYQQMEAPREYLRRAIALGIAFAVAAALFLWKRHLDLTLPTAIAAGGMVRYLIAYRRALQRGEEPR